jgi:hypothetical protein
MSSLKMLNSDCPLLVPSIVDDDDGDDVCDGFFSLAFSELTAE